MHSYRATETETETQRSQTQQQRQRPRQTKVVDSSIAHLSSPLSFLRPTQLSTQRGERRREEGGRELRSGRERLRELNGAKVRQREREK